MSSYQIDHFAKVYLPIFYIITVIISTSVHYLFTPLPESFSWKTNGGIDLLCIILFIPLFIHSIKSFGNTQASLLFFTVAIFMGSLESLWVLLGKLKILGDSYEYSTGFLRFMGVPVIISIGWYLWIYVYYYIASKVFPEKSIFFKSVICGILAVLTDLWIDPSTVNYHLVTQNASMWTWQPTKGSLLFTVPLNNFTGWFLAGFTVVLVYQLVWLTKKETESIVVCLIKITIGWVLFVVVTKALQIGLDIYVHGNNWYPLNLTKGVNDIGKSVMLGCIPTFIIGCISIYFFQVRKYPHMKKDLLLVLAYSVMVIFNMSMTYKLQLTYSSTYLIYILVVTMIFPFGLLMYYLMFRAKYETVHISKQINQSKKSIKPTTYT